MGIMEKKMETTGIRGYIGVVFRLYRDTGKDIGNYYNGVI